MAITFLRNINLFRIISEFIIPRVICLKKSVSQQKVAIATLGCKVNQYESAQLAQVMRPDLVIVPFSSFADIYIINTCTVTAQADFQSRQLIRRARRQNRQAKIIVTGCYADTSPAEINNIEGVSIVLGNKQKNLIPQIINNDRQIGKYPPGASSVIRDNSELVPLKHFYGHTRAFLKIQDGCDSYCSYCVIPYARGEKRSLPVSEVLNALDVLIKNNYREIVLTGIHLGAYGQDLSPRTDLETLLQEIICANVSSRIRLSSIEPLEISDKLLRLISANKIICPHLHIPLQSGDDNILRLMNRNYDSSYYRSLINNIAASVKNICLGVDVMVGFPGEGEEEFKNTYQLLEGLPVSYLHVFPYSDRPGTAAAKSAAKVPEKTKKERALVLRRLGARKKEAFASRFLGEKMQVLIEKTKDKKTGFYKGFSDNYLQILLPEADASLTNKIIEARVDKYSEGKLYGQIISR